MSAPGKVKIETIEPMKYRVFLNGQDITPLVRSVRFDARAGELPRVILTLTADLELEQTDADISVNEEL